MRYFKILFVIFIGILFVGCTTYSNHHYSLMSQPEKAELQVITTNIKKIIEPILINFGLKSAMTENMAEHILLYYSSGGDSALRVGVRVDQGKIVLDSFQYRSGISDSPEYTELRSELMNALEMLNGVKLVEIDGPTI